jgi:hypothetical protein
VCPPPDKRLKKWSRAEKPANPAAVGIPKPCLRFTLSQQCAFCGQALLGETENFAISLPFLYPFFVLRR